MVRDHARCTGKRRAHQRGGLTAQLKCRGRS
jgi:hypothetical protein